MTGTTPTSSALWDDYGYHHDDLVEPTSLVPMPRASPEANGWCRGREGHEHIPAARRSPHFAGTDGACEEMPSWWGFCLHEEACVACGAMLRRCIPRWECPDLSAT